MINDPKALAADFVRANPIASEHDAVAFAKKRYSESWYLVAVFLRYWMRLRKRMPETASVD